MNIVVLPVFACMVLAVSAWSTPFYPVRQYRSAPYRVLTPPHYTRHAYQPPAVHEESQEEEENDNSNQQRAKREHIDDYGKDFFHEQAPSHEADDKGVTGPVHTFVKTDKNANYKWGVRHHVGNKYAS